MNCSSDDCVSKPEWKWNNTTYDWDIYAHVFDQNGTNGGNGTPYRYISATSFGSNVCTNDMQTTHGSTTYSSISGQISCSPNSLNAGNWYNYPAATAGSDNHTVASNTEVLNSICPKGWRLPPNAGDKSYNTLIRTAYQIADGPSGSIDSNLLANSAMSFVRLGLYLYSSGSLNGRGSGGGYWSSTAYNGTNSRDLYFSPGYLAPQNSDARAYGSSIRCVSREAPSLSR